MPTFQPPTYEAPMRTLVKPLCYFRLTESQSVLKVAGHYVTQKTLYGGDLVGLVDGVDYFVGGHVYTVTTAVGNALVADGYTVT